MKQLVHFIFLLTITVSFAQEPIKKEQYTAHNKGKFFIYWGGNRDSFTKSNIHFYGDDYDFTIYDVEAEDKPKGWHIDYINPVRMTIPQTNLRLGYFFSNHYMVTLGVDHMKYVFTQTQTANVTGTINLPLTEPGSIYNDH